MRILAGFFALVFLFVNPAMFVHVLNQVERTIRPSIFSEVKPRFIAWMEDSVEDSGAADYLRFVNLALMGTLIILHLILTLLYAYGCFTGRPAYIRPMVLNCLASTFMLFLFLVLNILITFNVSSSPDMRMMRDYQSLHKSFITIGGIFFVIYLIWDAVTFYTYFDIRQLHKDFMYWIVEERNSQRRGSLRLSTRSFGSSKSSKGSKNSTKSSKMEDHSRPNSAAASIPSKKTSLANNRLSVPL